MLGKTNGIGVSQFHGRMMGMSGSATTAVSEGPTLHPKHDLWLKKRGIQSVIAQTMGVSTSTDNQGNWLVFPYRLDGRIVNRKFRLTAEKQHRMDQGGKLCLWNAEALRLPHVASGAPVIITEGEFDALIAIQSGFQATVSVPNGAPAERIDDPVNSNRYRFLWESNDDLERVKQFVLATDGDKPGVTLAHDLAAILGPERCKFVTYPDGCKDLNEVFLAEGAVGVSRVIDQAKPFPVKGLYRIDDFPEAPELQSMETGIDCLNEHMRIVLGTLTVFTGYANMGKTTVMNTVVAHAIAHGVPTCVASFETAPKPILIDGLAKAMIGCSDYEFANHPLRAGAYKEIGSKLTIISNALDEELEFDIDTFLDTARASIVRDGTRLIVLDPWNELEHKRRRDESLTEYVGRAIRRVKSFARRNNVAVWIVAHPTKPQKGVNQMPSLYDVSDSANWSNKADYGLVYHRPDKTVNAAQLAVVKVRMGLPGFCGVQDVFFDHRVSRVAGISPTGER
jgi:twinkle protein